MPRVAEEQVVALQAHVVALQAHVEDLTIKLARAESDAKPLSASVQVQH